MDSFGGPKDFIGLATPDIRNSVFGNVAAGWTNCFSGAKQAGYIAGNLN